MLTRRGFRHGQGSEGCLVGGGRTGVAAALLDDSDGRAAGGSLSRGEQPGRAGPDDNHRDGRGGGRREVAADGGGEALAPIPILVV